MMVSKKPGNPGFFAFRLSVGNFLIDQDRKNGRAVKLLRRRGDRYRACPQKCRPSDLWPPRARSAGPLDFLKGAAVGHRGARCTTPQITARLHGWYSLALFRLNVHQEGLDGPGSPGWLLLAPIPRQKL